ncbi:MAG: hypothetical protein ACXWFP_15790, partial [Methylobacter sp.]
WLPGCGATTDSARKKTKEQTDLAHWSFKKLRRSMISWFTRGLRYLKLCLQNDKPLPRFSVVFIN